MARQSDTAPTRSDDANARLSENVNEAQNQFLGTVRQSQEAVVKAVQAWSESVSRLVPDVSSLPLGDQYLNPAQAVDTVYDFAQQLLATQRDFAQRVLATTAPAAESVQEKATPDDGKRTASSRS
ncbi:MAG: hypothetical protein M3N52_01370 [Actinomycetota bacterium]|nr:hypothetical protein [Actinomycetota bacterium]